MQKLNIVELYCGCGGLSFVDRKNKDVHIETKWAVDFEPSMCAAFKANYPNAQVIVFLMRSAFGTSPFKGALEQYVVTTRVNPFAINRDGKGKLSTSGSLRGLLRMQVFEFGVDEWLALCKHFKRLSDKYPDDWQVTSMTDSDGSSVRHIPA